MLKKLVFSVISSAVLLSACGQSQLNESLPAAPLTRTAPAEVEPNYYGTLNNQGVQTPDIKNIFRFGKVNEKIYRGGLPTDSDLQALKDFKVKTVISFRGLGDPTEAVQIAAEKKVVESLGMKFINIQIPFDRPVPDKTIKSFFTAVNNPKNQPLFVHCKGGRDRTGIMVSLYRIKYEGYTAAQAIKEMQNYTFVPTDYPIFTKQIMEFNPAKIK